ncbi:MAG: Cof-type HAD-IIB family hydrolase [Erysipelotrichaceae bacterium]|nr:Cof-type HAD-IIB family hydrolase [Erysipelotrichaceae bacterium]MBQ1521192.1 Cof-type HAD-IIB family hydrolase [Erysipelotrichaceae bacterium]
MNIVFFDIDGTLATGRQVPASAAEGIARLRRNGDLVFICTGRNVNYARNNFGQYADGFICNNGRLAVFGDRVIFDEPLDNDVLKMIIEKLDSVKSGYVFHTSERGYYGGVEEGFEHLKITGDAEYMEKCSDFSGLRVYNGDIYYRSREHFRQIEKVLQDICLLNLHGPHPSADVTILGVDKGDAIIRVAEKLGVPVENTYAFGDGINDMCMLEKAGHGIAMGNAVAETKAVAEYITDDINSDGVYKGLVHYGLIGK